jgi:hypothetical protein
MSPGESGELAESKFEARRFLSALALDLPEEPDLELSSLEPYGVATVLSWCCQGQIQTSERGITDEEAGSHPRIWQYGDRGWRRWKEYRCVAKGERE